MLFKIDHRRSSKYIESTRIQDINRYPCCWFNGERCQFYIEMHGINLYQVGINNTFQILTACRAHDYLDDPEIKVYFVRDDGYVPYEQYRGIIEKISMMEFNSIMAMYQLHSS